MDVLGMRLINVVAAGLAPLFLLTGATEPTTAAQATDPGPVVDAAAARAGEMPARGAAQQGDGAAAYSATPSTPLPGNVTGVGFEATGTAEFGDYVGLATTDDLHSVEVVLSAHACQDRLPVSV
jgi:hypothetical protein